MSITNPKMQRKSICEPMDTLLAPNNVGNRKASIATSGRTPSITSQPRLSLVGLLASKRLSKQLSQRIIRKRSSMWEAAKPRPPPKEPTYRMAPDPEHKFKPEKVKECIEQILQSRLSGYRYSPKLSANMCKILSDEIKSQVKSMNFDRYKIVCSVTICQRKDQGASVSSRCTWDEKLDNFASFTYKNDSIFCTALVFGVYAE